MSRVNRAAGKTNAAIMRGVTLIELTMTLAVLGVVSSIAIPSFASAMRSNQATSYFNLLIGTLQMARAEALREHTTVLVCPGDPAHGCTGSLNWHQGWMVVLRPGPRGQPDAGSRIVKVQQALPKGVRVESSRGRHRVQYRADGSARGSNLSLRFCLGDQATAERALVVNNAGRARKVTGKALAGLPPCRI